MSTSDVAIYFGPNLISWWSKNQHVVARSITEVELRSLAQATAKLLWVQILLKELFITSKVLIILCYNYIVVLLARNPHTRTKHMEIDLFFVKQKILAK